MVISTTDESQPKMGLAVIVVEQSLRYTMLDSCVGNRFF